MRKFGIVDRQSEVQKNEKSGTMRLVYARVRNPSSTLLGDFSTAFKKKKSENRS